MYFAFTPFHITTFFQRTWTGNKKCNKLYDETRCINKICSRQRAIVTGKAATLLVRIIKHSTPLPAPTMKGTVKLCFLILSFSFLALFSIIIQKPAEILVSS